MLPRLRQISWERFYALSNLRARKILIIGKGQVTRHYVACFSLVESKNSNFKIGRLLFGIQVPIACRIVRTYRAHSQPPVLVCVTRRAYFQRTNPSPLNPPVIGLYHIEMDKHSLLGALCQTGFENLTGIDDTMVSTDTFFHLVAYSTTNAKRERTFCDCGLQLGRIIVVGRTSQQASIRWISYCTQDNQMHGFTIKKHPQLYSVHSLQSSLLLSTTSIN